MDRHRVPGDHYVFPDCLAPVHIDTTLDRGSYWEPNVWMVHPHPRRLKRRIAPDAPLLLDRGLVHSCHAGLARARPAAQ
jgi:hypothetical protein